MSNCAREMSHYWRLIKHIMFVSRQKTAYPTNQNHFIKRESKEIKIFARQTESNKTRHVRGRYLFTAI